MDDEPKFDETVLQSMNDKTIQNQFFTPDNVYIDLGLMKDIPIGVVYADQMILGKDAEAFDKIKNVVMGFIKPYQKRTYDTTQNFLSEVEYSDQAIADLLTNRTKIHYDIIFMTAPATHFLEMLIRHTVRNQNNSSPAEKFERKAIGNKQYVKQSIAVTYHINTYPLSLSTKLLERLGAELGEALGVNICFLNKDPATFDQSDWDAWMEKIDCFYLDSLGRFTRSPFTLKKKGDMQFNGCYIFARKRFEARVMANMVSEDFEQQIQMLTAQMDIFCDFAWIQNNDLRLTDDKEDVPVNEPIPEEKQGPTS